MGKNMMSKKGVLCGLFAAILSFAGILMAPVSAVEAEQVIEIKETMLDFGYASELGRSYTDSFTVENKSEEKIVVKITTEDYAKEIAGESKVAKEWLSFVGGKNVYEIDPASSVDVLVRFNVPTDAEKGRTQYVNLKTVVTSEAGKDATDEIVAKITTTDEQMVFGGSVDAKVSPFVFKDEISGSAIVKNDGKVAFESTVSVRVSPAFGLENWTNVVEETKLDVAPGESNAAVEFTHQMPYGVYKVEQKISYVNSEGKIITATSVSHVALCPIWLVAAVGGVIVLLIVLAIVIKIVRSKREEDASDSDSDSDADEKPKKKAKKSKKTKKSKKAEESEKVSEENEL